MTNITIVLAFITMIVAGGLLALSPSMMGNVQAEKYEDEYGSDNDYYKDDNKYSYDKKDKKSPHIDIQKIDCGNSNVNINGVDVTEIPHDNTAVEAANEGGTGAANTESSNGILDRINFERNLVNVCANANDNGQTSVNTEPQPPQEPIIATTYEVTGNLDTTSPFSSTAECDMGDVVTGGGFNQVGSNPSITSNHKATTVDEGWTVTGSSGGASPSLQAFAMCLTNPLSP